MVSFDDHGPQLFMGDGAVVHLVGLSAAADGTGWNAADL
jgi:hypothetical protein